MGKVFFKANNPSFYVLQDKEESLFLAVESLWSFARSKLRVTSEDSVHFTIEFPFANPKDLNTLPNRILQQLEVIGWVSVGSKKSSVGIKCLNHSCHIFCESRVAFNGSGSFVKSMIL